MLTRLAVKNFKRFESFDIELGEVVVLVGPNNGGKSSALQSLALWNLGVQRLASRRGADGLLPKKRPGVTLNRRELVALPVPETIQLWRDRHVRTNERLGTTVRTSNIRMEITVDGVTEGKAWSCGVEFDYINEESLHCRPLRKADTISGICQEAIDSKVALLPPMSGLIANETRLDPGAISVRVGEGRTAEVLRNLCWHVFQNNAAAWTNIEKTIERLFGARLDEPSYIPERGEVELTYSNSSREKSKSVHLDLSTSGRGMQQTLLLLSYLYANPGAVLLLDEPDAHLEILRQRQIYGLLTETAKAQRCQIVAASHSEVLLNEAADRDIVVAFLGKPHRIDDRGSQVAKSLKEIGFESYYQAEQTGWVLYLEGSTDLAILQAWASILKHPAQAMLERPFVHYVCNLPNQAKYHFFGLKEVRKDLIGFALFDRLDHAPESAGGLDAYMWSRREIENYLCDPAALRSYMQGMAVAKSGPLFQAIEEDRYVGVLEECIRELVPPIALRDSNHLYWSNVKASDEFLNPLFDAFYKRLDLQNLMRKTDYHQIARTMKPGQVPAEVRLVLDRIVEVGSRAQPTT